MLNRLENLDIDQRFELVNRYLHDSKALVVVSPLCRTEDAEYCDYISAYDLHFAIKSGTFRQYEKFCYVDENNDLYSIDDPFDYVDAETIFYHYEECPDYFETILNEIENA